MSSTHSGVNLIKLCFFHHQQWDNKCQMIYPEIFRNILSLIRTAKAYPSVALTMSFSFYRFLDLLDSRGKLALNKWGIFTSLLVIKKVLYVDTCSLLRRDLRESYKSKGNALVSVLAANILLFAFRNEKTWPEIFVRVQIL